VLVTELEIVALLEELEDEDVLEDVAEVLGCSEEISLDKLDSAMSSDNEISEVVSIESSADEDSAFNEDELHPASRMAMIGISQTVRFKLAYLLTNCHSIK